MTRAWERGVDLGGDPRKPHWSLREKGRRKRGYEYSTDGSAGSHWAPFCWVCQPELSPERMGPWCVYLLALSSLVEGGSAGVKSIALLDSAPVRIQGSPLVSRGGVRMGEPCA